MFANGFEIRQLPNGLVDCMSWSGAVMNTLGSVDEALAWAESERAPTLSRSAKAEMEKMKSLALLPQAENAT